MIGLVSALLMRQPDYGSVVVIAGMTCGMLFVAGTRLRHFLLVVVVAGGALALLAYAQPYDWHDWLPSRTPGLMLSTAAISSPRR